CAHRGDPGFLNTSTCPAPLGAVFPTVVVHNHLGITVSTAARTLSGKVVRYDTGRFSPTRTISAEGCGNLLPGPFGVSGAAKINSQAWGPRSERAIKKTAKQKSWRNPGSD